jgi:DNA polymerase iota
MRVWNTLHGVDNTDVHEARDLPTQISIEDSYRRGRLDSIENVRGELMILAKSLIRRMRTDLLDKSESNPAQPRWLAHPRTLRLSTRPRNAPETDGLRTYNAGRISRSAPLPTFIFNTDENIDALAERIVRENILTMFRKLHPEKSGWDLSLMNIAVTNLIESAGDQKQSSGRDIGKMFRQQETVLKDWTVHDPVADRAVKLQEPNVPDDPWTLTAPPDGADELWDGEAEDEDEEPLGSVECALCGATIPHFAQLAHQMYHAAED